MAKTRPTFSLTETAELIGVSRSTIERALRDGAPAVQIADRSRRQEWRLHVGDVAQWLIAQRVAKAEAAFLGEKGEVRRFKTRRLVAETILAEQRAEEELRRVVDVEYVTDRLTRFCAALRTQLSTVGAKVADRASAISQPTRIKELIDAELREALRSIDGAENIGAEK